MSARETISKNAAFTKAGTIHSISAQAQQILQQLTLEEKASLCSGKDFWLLKSLERLQLPSIAVADGPHGLRKQGAKGDHLGAGTSVPATCFPTASALACSWDPTLLYNLGEALAEKSADENVSVLLGPGINIKRHSSCGRNFEYFSEDPLLTGELAAAMINGVQSKNVGTSLKHFAVNNQEFNRMVTNAVVDERTLREIYLKGFEIAVKKAQPWTIMSAYNRVNGTFCSEHKELLTDILRDEWGFEGLVVTDWGAMNDRVKGIAAGLDLEMPGSTGETDQQIVKAVNHGELNEAQLDKVARRVIKLMLKAKTVIKAENIDEAAHHQLARKAAAESAVLLKNNEQILPLQTSAHFAVIGEFAKTPRYQGAGSSMVNPVKLDCAYDALSEITNNKSLPYAAGYRVKGDKGNNTLDQSLIDEAVVLAKTVDIAVVFAGLPDSFEAEGFDRDHLDMPEQHNRLIRAICKANPNTVVILSNGAAVQMPWIDQPKAVLETWLAGQAGGLAVADLILGKSNPGGKLAETFPLAMADMASDRWYPGSPRQVE
nr:glycoside hydrolase family 3 C-terminal domain-containing protein [Endozoicomonas sp.]